MDERVRVKEQECKRKRASEEHDGEREWHACSSDDSKRKCDSQKATAKQHYKRIGVCVPQVQEDEHGNMTGRHKQAGAYVPEVQEEDTVHRMQALLAVDEVIDHDDPLEHERLDARLVQPKVVGLERGWVESRDHAQAQLHRYVV